jgi:hypothetical protein
MSCDRRQSIDTHFTRSVLFCARPLVKCTSTVARSNIEFHEQRIKEIAYSKEVYYDDYLSH